MEMVVKWCLSIIERTCNIPNQKETLFYRII